jgi:hypothetical protein
MLSEDRIRELVKLGGWHISQDEWPEILRRMREMTCPSCGGQVRKRDRLIELAEIIKGDLECLACKKTMIFADLLIPIVESVVRRREERYKEISIRIDKMQREMTARTKPKEEAPRPASVFPRPTFFLEDDRCVACHGTGLSNIPKPLPGWQCKFCGGTGRRYPHRSLSR